MNKPLITEASAEMLEGHLREYPTELERVSHGVTLDSSFTDHLFPASDKLIEQVISRNNMFMALDRVVANKGAAGIDDMTVYDLKGYLQKHWLEVKERLLNGSYAPQSVKRVEIAKSSGGIRPLGIPTVLDRVIQQAIHQVLSPLFEEEFSDSSYGFRPYRSAHQAVRQAQSYQREGKTVVVDIDLKSFFDEVNHDILMGLLGKRISDKRLLKLIRSYLNSGVLLNGVCLCSDKGTPQGGPLSPLLSNIMLNEFDKELERRGHKFCRYADDCQIYVGSKRSGERVMTSLCRYLENRLQLKVNYGKSAVSVPTKRKFLGFSFTGGKSSKVRIPKTTIQSFKKKAKVLFRIGRGWNIEEFINFKLNHFLRGWGNYFKLADTKKYAQDLDEWLRRRLRLILWRQWKRPWTRRKKLMKQGLSEERAVRSAFNKRGPWWNSGASHMNEALKIKDFQEMGLFSLFENVKRK